MGYYGCFERTGSLSTSFQLLRISWLCGYTCLTLYYLWNNIYLCTYRVCDNECNNLISFLPEGFLWPRTCQNWGMWTKCKILKYIALISRHFRVESSYFLEFNQTMTNNSHLNVNLLDVLIWLKGCSQNKTDEVIVLDFDDQYYKDKLFVEDWVDNWTACMHVARVLLLRVRIWSQESN